MEITAESPCVGICVVDEVDVCEGCGRHVDDIAGWMGMSEAQRVAANERAIKRLRERLDQDGTG
ncbi:MAG: DUF1289 domain-containing protein [Gammaproteobacteria bacterium]|nr:DUF1289 domain-containing protein [Gammaproteobacteria bacterium]